MEKKPLAVKKAKKLTVSREKAKISTVNRKSQYPIETLLKVRYILCFFSVVKIIVFYRREALQFFAYQLLLFICPYYVMSGLCSFFVYNACTIINVLLIAMRFQKLANFHQFSWVPLLAENCEGDEVNHQISSRVCY